MLFSHMFQVAMSHFDKDKYIPYESLSNNLKIIRDRWEIGVDWNMQVHIMYSTYIHV